MLAILYEKSPDAVYVYDYMGNFIEGNPEIERVSGYTKEELLNRNFAEMNIIAPEDLHIAVKNIEENLQGKSTGPDEMNLIQKSGNRIIVEMRTYPFTLHDQLLVMGVARDITERKKSEELIQSSENRYRTVFEAANDGLIIYSMDTGEVIDVNEKFCEMLKTTKKQCLEDNVGHFVKNIYGFPVEITAEWVQQMATEGPQTFELQIKNNSDELIWVEANLTLITIDNQRNVLAIIRDINERKVMENKLNALHQHAISLGKASSIAEISETSMDIIKNLLGFTFTSFQMVDGDELKTIDFMSDTTLKARYSDSYLVMPIMGKGITTRVVRENKAILVNDVRNDTDFVVGNGGNSLSELAVPITLDNKVLGVLNVESMRLNAFTEQDQYLLEILANHISAGIDRINKIENLERLVKERTDEIRVIEQKYQNVSDVTGLQVWEYDITTENIWVSSSLMSATLGKQFTMPVQNYLSLLSNMIHVEDRERVLQEINTAFKERTPFNSEYRVYVGKDQARWYKVNSKMQHDENGAPQKTLGIAVDITEIKSMQDQLERQNEALRELDEMKNRFISTISHELRTPITSFKGYLELIEDKTTELPEDIQKYVDTLSRNTDRLITLTDDLLDQQRIQTGRLQINTEPIDINKIVYDSVNEIKVLTDSKNISIMTEIQKDTPTMTADPVRVQQVIVNLLHNAYKFSPEGAEIKVTMKQYGDNIHITVSDHGIGLTKKQIALLFKPFPGIDHGINIVGTGLGLSICKGLIELHGGSIWVESKGLGKGSNFHFTLPLNVSENNAESSLTEDY